MSKKGCRFIKAVDENRFTKKIIQNKKKQYNIFYINIYLIFIVSINMILFSDKLSFFFMDILAYCLYLLILYLQQTCIFIIEIDQYVYLFICVCLSEFFFINQHLYEHMKMHSIFKGYLSLNTDL